MPPNRPHAGRAPAPQDRRGLFWYTPEQAEAVRGDAERAGGPDEQQEFGAVAEGHGLEISAPALLNGPPARADTRSNSD